MNQGMLHRPRMHALIEEGLRHPLLVLLAGPGYGKTQAMADFFERSHENALWLRLSPLDNLPGYFWDHLIRVLVRAYPEIRELLMQLEFPMELSSFGTFAKLLAYHICGTRRIIWVMDDYGEIDNQQVKGFFRMLVEADLEYFHLVLISNVLTSAESIAFMSSKRFLIMTGELRFTRHEIEALYSLQGIRLESDELTAIERYTEGWPFALQLLVVQEEGNADFLYSEEGMTPRAVSSMFEERFFAMYPLRQQKLLVQLAMLDSFTKELAIDLYTSDPAELVALDNHVFLIGEPSSERFYFHYLYRLFLQKKAYYLNAEEKERFWRKAADYYASRGGVIEAVACYARCGDYVRMLEAIGDSVKSDKEVTETTAAYFLTYIDLLTPGQLQEYPVAEYLRARLYLSTLKLDEAEALMLGMEQRLLGGEAQGAQDLLIDVYAMLGNIHMMRNQEDFGDFYKKAADCLPAAGGKKRNSKLMTLNIHTFSMADNRPGAKERMERAVHYGVPWMAKVLSGAMSGMEHIFSAEAAYLSNRMDDAQQHAYRGIYKAQANDQHDLVCNGHVILARVGLMQGSFAEMDRQVQNVVEYAGRYNIGVLREIRDTLLGWYYIKLRDHKRIPRSILEIMKTERPILAHGRPQIVYANYLVNTGEYAMLIGMLEHPTGLFLASGIWPDRICLYILLAISYQMLGNADAAMNALWNAYDMCYHNGLTTLFIESGGHMRSLLDTARQQQKHAFDREWIAHVYGQAGDFAKRADAVRAAYRKQNPEKVSTDNPLSRRERDVLQAISRGLTREEIAVEHYISVNTVKSTIRNIYNKLNANNKADAVSIAITHGYIEGYPVE